MAAGFFITGTDTNVGKTWVTVALMRKLKQLALCVAGMKPVASGCYWRQGKLVNSDALMILENSDFLPDYCQVNPYAFELALSPHIARGHQEIQFSLIQAAFTELQAKADIVVVEGAGGWLSPFTTALDNAGLAERLQLPVILVVGMRLGCINHARLTYQAICQSTVPCAGWVAVQLEPEMPGLTANLEYLQQSLNIPFLGSMPHLSAPDFDYLAARLKSVESLI
jgi:dethiobiotin synthetase